MLLCVEVDSVPKLMDKKRLERSSSSATVHTFYGVIGLSHTGKDDMEYCDKLPFVPKIYT